ncbi:hypothetical protein ACFPLB_04225 [Aquamicrobium segne]|uniref:DUF2188 domain-containing protein n=2 Tax=Aquamicrobium segne TaxID=469547 RepID=A0ABW0GWC2_9HYPH
MQVNGRYRPLFRLFCSDRWKFVRKNGVPVECDTAREAVEAAKECVKAILNPKIRSEGMEISPAIPEFLDAEAWSRERAEKQAQQQEETFETVFVKHRPVKVQKLRRRAR